MGFGEVAMAALYFVLRFGLAFSDRLGGSPNADYTNRLSQSSFSSNAWDRTDIRIRAKFMFVVKWRAEFVCPSWESQIPHPQAPYHGFPILAKRVKRSQKHPRLHKSQSLRFGNSKPHHPLSTNSQFSQGEERETRSVHDAPKASPWESRILSRPIISPIIPDSHKERKKKQEAPKALQNNAASENREFRTVCPLLHKFQILARRGKRSKKRPRCSKSYFPGARGV